MQIFVKSRKSKGNLLKFVCVHILIQDTCSSLWISLEYAQWNSYMILLNEIDGKCIEMTEWTNQLSNKMSHQRNKISS